MILCIPSVTKVGVVGYNLLHRAELRTYYLNPEVRKCLSSKHSRVDPDGGKVKVESQRTTNQLQHALFCKDRRTYYIGSHKRTAASV